MSAPERSRSALPWQAVVAATVLALTAAAMVFVLTGDDGDESSDTAVPIELQPEDGDRAGDPLRAEFTDESGTVTNIRTALGDRPMVVNFFGSWCTPCVKEMPDFETVSQELTGEVDFLGLAVNDRPEDAATIIDETGVTYPWGRDDAGDVIGSAQIPSMPSTMFVSADGEIVDIQPGAVDAERLRELIAEHLGVTS